ncbi:hypothetical protein, partial [Bradyrhizobium sp. 48]
SAHIAESKSLKNSGENTFCQSSVSPVAAPYCAQFGWVIREQAISESRRPEYPSGEGRLAE